IAIGDNTTSTGDCVIVGNNSTVFNPVPGGTQDCVAVGPDNVVEDGGVAVGSNNWIGINSIGIGHNIMATGNLVVIGNAGSAGVSGYIAIGNGTQAASGTAVGDGAIATSTDARAPATAYGIGSNATTGYTDGNIDVRPSSS